MNVHREVLLKDFPITEESRVQEMGRALILEPQHLGIPPSQYHALEIVVEEKLQRNCNVVVHMQDEIGENPSNYYTKRIKVEGGRTKRIKLPVLPSLQWVEIFSGNGEILLRELNGLRILPPFSEHEVASPTSSTVVVPRGKVRFTPSGFEVSSNFLDTEAPVFAT